MITKPVFLTTLDWEQKERLIEKGGKQHMSNSTSLKNTTLRSDEFSCPSCINKIETRLKGMDGVESAEVKFASGRVLVTHDPAKVPVRTLVEAIAEVGYMVKPSAI